jgi:flagellar biosynthesis GTPase FlhF
VEYAAIMPGGKATQVDVVRHRQYLAHMEANSAAGTLYASPTNPQLAAQMQQIQQQIRKQTEQIQQQIQQLQQQMQQQQQQQQHMEVVSLSNALCYRLEEPVRHFPNAAGQPAPHCIPATFGALDALNSNNSRTCLQYYGLEQHGTAIECRRRLAEHLGVILEHSLRALENKLEGMARRQRRADAWHRNYSALDGTDFLVSFPNDNGDPAPQSFPRTLQALLDLSDDDLLELNAHYGLEGGNMRRLGLFLGVASRFTLKPVV